MAITQRALSEQEQSKPLDLYSILWSKETLPPFPTGRYETTPNAPQEPKIKKTIEYTTFAKTIKNEGQNSLQQWLNKLGNCESGGDYTKNTGNGFYGRYQFMISTWNRIAPKVGRPDLVGVRPDLATPADQDFMIIQNTILSKGGLSSQNPGCYNKLGLENKPPK